MVPEGSRADSLETIRVRSSRGSQLPRPQGLGKYGCRIVSGELLELTSLERKEAELSAISSHRLARLQAEFENARKRAARTS